MNNELLDRYLAAVKRLLPSAQSEDIVRELRENIQSEVEDKETALGRPLTEAEAEDMLKQHGHPMVAAARYQPKRYLIGPNVFPHWWRILKIALVVALVVHGIVSAALFATGTPGGQALHVLLRFFSTAFYIFAAVTLVFAAMDYALANYLPRRGVYENWDPRHLPSITLSAQQSARTRAVCELTLILIGMLWWIAIPHHPWLVLGPAASFLQLAPGWQAVVTPIVLLFLVQSALYLLNWVRPQWTRLVRLTPILVKIIGLVMMGELLSMGAWVAAIGSSPQPIRVAALGNSWTRISLIVVAIIMFLQILWELRRLIVKTRSIHLPAISF